MYIFGGHFPKWPPGADTDHFLNWKEILLKLLLGQWSRCVQNFMLRCINPQFFWYMTHICLTKLYVFTKSFLDIGLLANVAILVFILFTIMCQRDAY